MFHGIYEKIILIIYIENGITSSYSFYNCSNLIHINIPYLVTSICNYSFSNKHFVAYKCLPNSITSLGFYALLRVKNDCI